MAYQWDLNTCSISIKLKKGTLSSGADSIKTYTLGGASQSADAEKILEVSDAIGSIIDPTVIEVLRVDDYLVTETE